MTFAALLDLPEEPEDQERRRTYAALLRREAALFRLAGGVVTATEWAGFTPLERRALVSAVLPQQPAKESGPAPIEIPEDATVLGADGERDVIAALVGL